MSYWQYSKLNPLILNPVRKSGVFNTGKNNMSFNTESPVCNGNVCTKKKECNRYIGFEIAQGLNVERYWTLNPTLQERCQVIPCKHFVPA